MCLILFAWQAHPRYPLVVAANRDEFHQRPSAAAEFWEDDPRILAGRDLQAGGTWLGVTRSGRFAAVTNYREAAIPGPPRESSRGHLVGSYLKDDKMPLDYARELEDLRASYSGYNLLVGTRETLVYTSNRNGSSFEVQAGSHGLSNHLLNTDWPKIHSGRERLDEILSDTNPQVEAFFELLTDKTLAPGEMPHNLEESLAPEQLMKHYFIVSPVYGTRCSTVVLMDRDGKLQFHERQFDPEGRAAGTRSFQIQNRQPLDAAECL